jgi:hypothetical protein
MGHSFLLIMLNIKYVNDYFTKIADAMEQPKVWAIFTAIGVFISQYVFSQWIFAFGFFCIFILDTISGVYIARRTRTYDPKILRDKLMDKSVAYFIIIISFSIATKITLEGSDWNFIRYLNIPFYSLFIYVEFRSIIVKWHNFKKWDWLGELLEMIGKKPKIPPQNDPE